MPVLRFPGNLSSIKFDLNALKYRQHTNLSIRQFHISLSRMCQQEAAEHEDSSLHKWGSNPRADKVSGETISINDTDAKELPEEPLLSKRLFKRRYHDTLNEPGTEEIAAREVAYENESAKNTSFLRLSDPKKLEAAMMLLHKKFDTNSPWIKKVYLRQFPKPWFQEMSKLLRRSAYKFTRLQSSRNGTQSDPINPPTVDAIVHQAIRTELSRVFEPVFSDNSHAFRPGRGPHTALLDLRMHYNGTPWILHWKLSGCVRSIRPGKLRQLIRDHTNCKRTDELIGQILDSGIINFREFAKKKMGPQERRSAGLHSTFLNIYLNKLDEFIQIERARHINNIIERKRLQTEISHAESSVEKRVLIRNYKLFCKDHPVDPVWTKIRFLRYADEIIVGVTGHVRETQPVIEKVEAFLTEKLGLDLKMKSFEKTYIYRDHFTFLDMDIFLKEPEVLTRALSTARHRAIIQARRENNRQRMAPNERTEHVRTKKIYWREVFDTVDIKSKDWKLQIFGDTDAILRQLKERGFVYRNERSEWLGCTIGRLTNRRHGAILQFYNHAAQEMINYYSCTNNYHTVRKLVRYMFRVSCVVTLAKKYKLPSKRKVYLKYGKELKCPESGLLYYEAEEGLAHKFDEDAKYPDVLLSIDYFEQMRPPSDVLSNRSQ